jgi:DNA-binding beta-propeller fold protein YncE
MKRKLTRRTLLEGAGSVALLTAATSRVRAQATSQFILTNHTADAVTFLAGDDYTLVPVAPSPWGVAIDGNGRGYVASAQGMSVVDLTAQALIETVPYLTAVDSIEYGEYRPGGMGIAVALDGATVAVGINISGSNGVCELFDIASGAFLASIPVGVRPFDVVSSLDSNWVYPIDHDSFTVTAIELATHSPTTIDAAPLGYGQFDKPHYAAVSNGGVLMLPYVGQVLWELDPVDGSAVSLPMTADTHQHGIALSEDLLTAYIVGTGPAGSAPGPPSLTILDLESAEERVIVLELPHEQVALTADERTAILTGGYTFADGGWDGITRIDLASGEISTLEIPGRPLAIRRI